MEKCFTPFLFGLARYGFFGCWRLKISKMCESKVIEKIKGKKNKIKREKNLNSTNNKLKENIFKKKLCVKKTEQNQ